MRLFFEVARRGFRRYATYRAATIAGLFTNTVFGFLRTAVLIAVFHSRARVGNFDARDAITYVWLTQGLLATVYIWGWFEVAERIRTGDIVTDLFRPIDAQWYYYAQDLGRGAYHLLARGIAPMVTGALIFSLRFPENPVTIIAFAVSIFLGVSASFAVRFIVNLSAFWLLDYRGPAMISMVVVNIFSGFIIPIAFFPHALGVVARLLPFTGMMQTPIDIFLEKYTGWSVLRPLSLQVMWVVALFAAGHWVTAMAKKKVVIQGG